MTGTNGNGNTVVSGKVVRVNDRGLVLTGRDGWLNVSKFASGVEIPPVGAVVNVTLDKAGFIRAIEAVVSEPERMVDHSGAAPAPQESGPPPERDRVITRQWAVNAAINYIGGDGVGLDDVLTVAARLETWALRPV